MPYSIPDAPWIRETERTGYCSGSWWNNPPEPEDEPDEEEDYDDV